MYLFELPWIWTIHVHVHSDCKHTLYDYSDFSAMNGRFFINAVSSEMGPLI